MKKALCVGMLSFLVIGVAASIVGAQRTARRLDPTAFRLGGWAADEALWFDPFRLTTVRPETTTLTPRLATTGSSSPGIKAALSTKAAPSTAAALTSPLAALSSPEAPTSPATTVLSPSPEPDQTLSGSESALTALSGTESPTSPTTTVLPTSPGTEAAPSAPAPEPTLPLTALSSTESPTSPTTTALSQSPEPDQTLSGFEDSPVPLSARPPIRIPYRPVLRSPFRPPLL